MNPASRSVSSLKPSASVGLVSPAVSSQHRVGPRAVATARLLAAACAAVVGTASMVGCGVARPDRDGAFDCHGAAITHGAVTVCDGFGTSAPAGSYTCTPEEGLSVRTYATSGVAPRDLCPPGTVPSGVPVPDAEGSQPNPGGPGEPDPTGSGSDPAGAGSERDAFECVPNGDVITCVSTVCDAGYHVSSCGTCVLDGCAACACDDAVGSPKASGCTLTVGYWKSHPEDWPVVTLILGGRVYSKPTLLALLELPTNGDASRLLAHQLIAALLNGSNGAAADAEILAQAEAWLTANSAGGALPYGVTTSSPAGAEAVAIARQLDAHNNGKAGVPHCDAKAKPGKKL
jgi:hypothetical protein